MPFAGILAEGVPAPSPSRCVACGQDRRPLADTGVLIPGWGVVQVCVGTDRQPGCILQLAESAGCLMPGARAELERKLYTLESQVEALTVAVQRQEGEEPTIEVVSADEVVEKISARLGA